MILLGHQKQNHLRTKQYQKAKIEGGRNAIVKSLIPPLSRSIKEQFRDEVALLENLKHKNILTLYGHREDGENFSILTEFYDQSLREYLDIYHRNHLKSKKFFSFAKQAVSAIVYIHREEVIHQDIRSHNFFLTASGVLKLAEFDRAKITFGTDSVDLSEGENIRYGWQPPEVLTTHEISKASDVYSFHVVLWELLTKQIPFKGLTRFTLLQQVVRIGNRPAIPDSCSDELRQVLTKGWNGDRTRRPRIDDVEKELDHLARNSTFIMCFWLYFPKQQKTKFRQNINYDIVTFHLTLRFRGFHVTGSSTIFFHLLYLSYILI